MNNDCATPMPIVTREHMGDFGLMLGYITKADNVWDETRWLDKRSMQGTSFGLESQFTYKYLMGNAFAEGFIGDYSFKLMKNHKIFKLYIKPLVFRTGAWPDEPTLVCQQQQRHLITDFLAQHFTRTAQ